MFRSQIGFLHDYDYAVADFKLSTIFDEAPNAFTLEKPGTAFASFSCYAPVRAGGAVCGDAIGNRRTVNATPWARIAILPLANCNGAAMPLDNRLCRPQAESRSDIFLGGEKRLKDAIDDASARDPWAVVGDYNFNHALPADFRE